VVLAWRRFTMQTIAALRNAIYRLQVAGVTRLS
jgi:hypothetical protein